MTTQGSLLSRVMLSLAAAMTAASVQAVTLYVSADAATSGDGSSWANAFQHVNEAIAAFKTEPLASEAVKEIRVAQGIYQFTAKVTQPAGCVIRGGYKGGTGADADTRDVDNYQTIFTNDRDLDDRWNHVIVGDDGNATVTDSGINIYQADGATGKTRLVLPALADNADDAYVCLNVGSNASFTWKFTDNTGTLDGIWYHYNGALVAQNDYGTTVNGTITILNCRLIGAGNLYMSGAVSPYVGYDVRNTLVFGVNVANNGYMCFKGTSNGVVNRENTFRSCYASGGGALGFGSLQDGLVEHCISTGVLFDQTGAPKDSVFRNNYAAGVITGVGSSTLSNCVFACNRKVVKTAGASSYYFVGENNSASTGYIYDSLFISNRIIVAGVSPSISRYAVGIVGQGDYNSSLTLANCTFDHNTAVGIEVNGIGAYISRGSVLFNYPGTGKGGSTTIANCTFLSGDEDTLAYDVVSNSKTTTVRNSIFMSDADVAQAITADAAGSLTLQANTAKNVTASPFDKDAKWQLDEIPLKREASGLLVPKVATPGIRDCSTFAKNRDAEGTVYTDDNKIRGAVARIDQPADTKVLVLRKNPVTGGDFDCESAIAVGTAGATVTATARSGNAFTGWTTVDGVPYSTDNPLTISALTNDPTILVANFEMAKTVVRFNLGAHAAFNGTSESIYEVELDVDADFPAVPAFTVDEGWYFTGWDKALPTKVAGDFEATAQYVESFRESWVEEGATGDGTTSATPTGDFAAAYAYAGVSSGKVHVKGGSYAIAEFMPLCDNVEVVSEDGGRIVLTGTNSTGAASVNFCFNVNSSEATVGTAKFEKIDFIGFTDSAIYAHGTAAKGLLVLRNCTFSNCGSPAVDVVSADVAMTNVTFASLGTALTQSGNTLSVDRIVRANISANESAFSLSNVQSDFTHCVLTNNSSIGTAVLPASLFEISGGTFAISDSVISGNYLEGRPYGLIKSSGAATVTRCAFGQNSARALLKNNVSGVFYVSDGTLLVRDSHFVGTVARAVLNDDGGILAGILMQSAGTSRFVNCTVLDSEVTRTIPNNAALFYITGGTCRITHSAIANTLLGAPDSDYPTYDLYGNGAITLENSVVLNNAADYAGIGAADVTVTDSFTSPTDEASIKRVYTNDAGLVSVRVSTQSRAIPAEQTDAFGAPRKKFDVPGPLSGIPMQGMLLFY